MQKRPESTCWEREGRSGTEERTPWTVWGVSPMEEKGHLSGLAVELHGSIKAKGVDQIRETNR